MIIKHQVVRSRCFINPPFRDAVLTVNVGLGGRNRGSVRRKGSLGEAIKGMLRDRKQMSDLNLELFRRTHDLPKHLQENEGQPLF